MTIKRTTKRTSKKAAIKPIKVIKAEKDEPCMIDVIGNKLWILAKEPSNKLSNTLDIAEFDKPFSIEWHPDRTVFINDILGGYNLLKNGSFSDKKGKSLINWDVCEQVNAKGGVDLSSEWQLSTGHTAFLMAHETALRPSLSAKQKIPIIDVLDYRFSGYFATQRADGVVQLEFYDVNNKKLDEQLIDIKNDNEHFGGKALDNYARIEYICKPVKMAQYIQLKIKLREQTDLTQENGYLFFTKLFFGVSNKNINFGSCDLYSLGAYQLSTQILKDKSFRYFGEIQLPELHNIKQLTVKAGNYFQLIDLENELEIIHFLSNEQKKIVSLIELNNPSNKNLLITLGLEELQKLNPMENFSNIFQAISILIEKEPVQKLLRIHEDDKINADFYLKLATDKEIAGYSHQAIDLFKLSILFLNTPVAHEHLGNYALSVGNNHSAIAYYKISLNLNNTSYWVYLNLAKAQCLLGLYEESLKTLCLGSTIHPSVDLFISAIDEYINNYWNIKNTALEALAIANEREKLIDEHDNTTRFICNIYAQFFNRNSSVAVSKKLNNRRVLIIGLTFNDAPQCFRYRIDQKLEQLKYIGYDAETVCWSNYQEALNLINFYDVIIFYRTPSFPVVLKLLEYVKSLGKITFFELDDLLFEPDSIPAIETYGGQISISNYINITKDIGYYHSMAIVCDYAIASTLPLLERLAPLVITKVGYLHRNGLDKYNWTRENTLANKEHISLFYGSGTLAHNSDFIIEALPAIRNILNEFRSVRLVIVGYLSFPEKFIHEFKNRIIQVPFTQNIETYLNYLSSADINLAVLHDNVLTGCKSELKWFEAATYSIPSIVSNTKNYTDIIKHGKDGFIVNNTIEWYSTIKLLIEDTALRQRVGRNAHKRVMKEYSIQTLANNIDITIKNAISNKSKNNQTKKKKIVLVNVLFPPKSLGGATRIAVDELSILIEQYEVVVFTANLDHRPVYQLNVYPYDGCRIYEVSAHINNWQYKDENIRKIFEDFIKFEEPDLIHFHCIQALTASIVEVAQQQKIPHLITIHDAWWISDYQFLTDDNNNIYSEGHPDVFKKFDLPESVSLNDSLKRRSYLKKLLLQSNGVLAVSDKFRKIYQKNGISNIITNKNGISNNVIWKNKDTSYTSKVVCAHIGGISPHKGFDIFKEAVIQLHTAPNIEILVVDHSKEQRYLITELWGTITVKIIGHVNQKDIVDLYKKIDVLFAPSICPESFGLVTREAAACGCWVVASNVGAIGEDIYPNNGVKITPTKNNIINVFNKINVNPGKYKKLANIKGIRYASDQVKELVVLFNKVINNHEQ